MPTQHLTLHREAFHKEMAPNLAKKLDDVAAQLQSLQSSVDFLSNKYDTINDNISQIMQKLNLVEQNKREIEKLKLENQCLHRDFSKLQEQVNHLDQYGRRNNLEIHGVDEKPNENLGEILTSIANTLNLPYDANGVEGVHRLPMRKKAANRPPAIIVRFVNRQNTAKWLEKKKTDIECRNVISNGSQNLIYINENLSPINKELFWNARVRGKELNFKFVWVKNGSIFMRKDENATSIRIGCMEDLPKAGDTLKKAFTATTSALSRERMQTRANRNTPVDETEDE